MSGGFLSMTSETLKTAEPEYFKPKTMESTWKLGEPIDPSTMPPGKTPVSLLTECCTRKSVTPVLQLVGDGGDVGEKPTTGPSFTYMYEVNGMKATGRGKNKKFAKHLAAKRILEMIIKSGQHIEWAVPGRTADDALTYLNGLMPELNDAQSPGHPDSSADGVDGAESAGGSTQLDNPVGKVNEKCLRMKLAIPQYEVVEEKGQPNDKNFVLSCRVGSGLETRGEGRNKKIAKRNAAIEMLKIIESLPSEATLASGNEDALCSTEDDLVGGDCEGRSQSSNGVALAGSKLNYYAKQLEALNMQETDPGPFSKQLLCNVMGETADLGQHEPLFSRALIGLSQRLPPLSALDRQRLEAFFVPIRQQPASLLRAVRGAHSVTGGGADFSTAINYKQVLATVAEDYHFGVEYIHLDDSRYSNGQYQCLVQLAVNPLAVCHGTASSKEMAEYAAAHNALQYLKVMSKSEE
uniref:DRBM domain-containing protein n=1 Tax=Plectus sambesii TaxID=2011161 RepID=A0A914WTQ1_9BILA